MADSGVFLFPTNMPDTILNLQMGGAYSWLYQSNPMRYIGIQIWFGILFTVAYYFVSVFFVFMSKKMKTVRTVRFVRADRTAPGHCTDVTYLAMLTI